MTTLHIIKRPKGVLLARAWTPSIDPTGWWMSEKFDGVRAVADDGVVTSRYNNRFPVPEWFVEPFPRGPFDGELWLGPGQLQKTVSIVKNGSVDKGWAKITYRVFDLPTIYEPFETRMEVLKRIAKGVPRMVLVQQTTCKGYAHLAAELKRVESKGGEGIMLREPESYYVGKRSRTLLKVKSFYEQEAKVIGYVPGTGRNEGRVGSLLCRLKNGIEFAAGGLTDYHREHPPRVGSKVTVRYQNLTDGGVPRTATYVVERDYE
jgi:DNA ligase-1